MSIKHSQNDKMSRNETINQLLAGLEFSNRSKEDKDQQERFKAHLLRFLQKASDSNKSFSKLNYSTMKYYTDMYLDEEEGAQYLTDCCGNDHWESDLALTKEKLYELAKKWVKSARTRRDRSNSKTKQPKRKMPCTLVHDVEQPSTSNRLPYSVIDLTENNNETGLHSSYDNASEAATNGSHDVAASMANRTRDASIGRDSRDYWSADAEPERTRGCTEEIALVGHVAADNPPTPQVTIHSNLPSPPVTGLRAVRPREEHDDFLSPTNARPAKRHCRELKETGLSRVLSHREKTLLAVYTEESNQEGAADEEIGTPTISNPATPRTFIPKMSINTNATQTTCHLNSHIIILSQEVQLMHGDLAKIPSMVLEYLLQCEQHLARTSDTNILSVEERELRHEKSRLLRAIRTEIAIQIVDIAHGRSSEGRVGSKRDLPVANSFVL